ncbi:taste receptor type 2 member 40-like [Bufo gargarizans]|uniref:taste receptor type 2 member 40-like n=1 Tax=Bufo gargarizans TaxID=30331 RepID=UPI001CF49E57|nr:taste receptor type 2 member 40-like [Bufo gargarizans]
MTTILFTGLVVNLISLLITIPGCTFILVVNILDWMKNKRLDISDQLISGITLCILVHRLQHTIFRSMEFVYDYYKIIKYMQLSYFSLILCTLLFSTWLAIHFCLKIVNINNKVYIYIQRRFSKMFPWILLPSIFASVTLSAPAALRLTREQVLNSTQTAQNLGHIFLEFLPYLVFSFLCFLLFFSSALNIILSLQRHIKHINDNTIALGSEIVKAHVTAVRTVVSLLTFNLFYFALLLISIVAFFYQFKTRFISYFYALCHICGVPILIQGSSKLRKKLHAVWICFSSLDKT